MLNNLRLQHFRAYRDETFEFEPGVNIVVGPNASGKTNLLEAILVLASGSSYRARDVDLIQFKKAWARVEGQFSADHTRIVKIGQINGRFAKQYELDGKIMHRLNLEQSLPVVIFEPGHLQLLSRGPEYRRDYLDDLLSRSLLGYKTNLNAYRRALAQRNSLLKSGRARADQQLFVWDVRLSDLAGQIVSARCQLIQQINQRIGKSYSQIAGRQTRLKLSYQNQFPLAQYSSKMLAKLAELAELDLARGFTGVGPHREDFAVELNRQSASITASRGETRSLLLALKLYELELIAKRRGAQPIFLLDDVFSELDGSRRRALVDHLKDQQTIITTTDADAVMEYFASDRIHLIALSKA